MIELLLVSTAAAILWAMAVAYFRYRDPLHPLMFIGPMMLYIYAFIPGIFYYRGQLTEFFSDENRLAFALTYTALGVAAFCVGCLKARIPRETFRVHRQTLKISPLFRKNLLAMSYLLAAVGVGSFLYLLIISGGLTASYGSAKGGVGGSPSGYVTEASLLTIVAIVLYLIAHQGDKITIKMIITVLVFASPHLIHGILGARRGPTFLILFTIIFGWYLVKARRPSLRMIIAAIGVLGILLLFLVSQRNQIFIGSDFQFDEEAMNKAIAPSEISSGETSVYSLGLILASDYHHRHFWGKRMVAQLLVRPVPKQLWPTKYEDTGMEFMVTQPGSGGMTGPQWREALGWIPESGSASGFVADSFLELSWGGLILCYLLGWVFSYLWKRAVIDAGVWNIIYLEASALSVYIPTQGMFSAWAYRFMFLAIPTFLIWKWILHRQSKGLSVLPGFRMQTAARGPGAPRPMS